MHLRFIYAFFFFFTSMPLWGLIVHSITGKYFTVWMYHFLLIKLLKDILVASSLGQLRLSCYSVYKRLSAGCMPDLSITNRGMLKSPNILDFSISSSIYSSFCLVYLDALFEGVSCLGCSCFIGEFIYHYVKHPYCWQYLLKYDFSDISKCIPAFFGYS